MRLRDTIEQEKSTCLFILNEIEKYVPKASTIITVARHGHSLVRYIMFVVAKDFNFYAVTYKLIYTQSS